MYFLAVDPGRTTGLAMWHPNSEVWDAYQTTNEREAMRWLEQYVAEDSEFEITVEKYTGGGYKTADGIWTTELVGWFSNHFAYYYGKTVRRPISQQRLSGMERAKELMEDSNIPGPHSLDALAHAVVHARIVAGES